MNQLESIKKHLPAAAALGLLLAVAPAPAGAADDPVDTGWRLRFYAGAVDMQHSSAGLNRPGGSSAAFDGDVGGGLGVNAEYRFSRRLGIDLGVFNGANVGIEAHTYRAGDTSWVSYDTLTFTPVTVGLDIHLTPEDRVDLYAAPLLAVIQYGELTMAAGPHSFRTGIDFDEDLALGAALGIGVPFGGDRWSFQANVTYLDSDLKGRGANGVRIESGYESTIFGLGFGYRFGQGAG